MRHLRRGACGAQSRRGLRALVVVLLLVGSGALRAPTGSTRAAKHRRGSLAMQSSDRAAIPATLNFAPYQPPESTPAPQDSTDLPLLLYLPGIEGTGISVSGSQFPSLSRHYEIHQLTIAPSDRSTFDDLLSACDAYLTSLLAQRSHRKVVLLGESFGGVLALSLAATRATTAGAAASSGDDPLSAVFVINPATCFSETPWPRLAPLLVRAPRPAFALASVATFMATIPDAAQVADVAGELLDPRRRTPLRARPAALARRISTLVSQISEVARSLPSETLDWRLQRWMVEGTARANAELLPRVTAPVTVLAGTADRLLPSAEEARRLATVLPDCTVVELKGHGHAALFDSRVDLAQVMAEQQRKRQQRASLTAGGSGGGGGGSAAAGRASQEGDVADFAQPDAETVELALRAVDVIKGGVSPVFFSTRSDGTICSGVGGIPDKDPSRPILFVGNHQFLAVEVSLLYQKLIQDKGILPRGMAHPAIIEGRALPGPMGPALRDAFNTFGAVPVSARNMLKVLQNKEAVLLFPGGAREAYHLRGEENRLFWPDASEFVRMAAATNAIIVPFSAIGSAESFNLLLDTQELMGAPVIGPALRGVAASMPSVRGGDDVFMSPLALPKAPRRQYTLFGPPTDCAALDKRDRAACDGVYRRLKEEVEGGIALLLRARQSDPYESFRSRLIYQTLNGGVAPTVDTALMNRLRREVAAWRAPQQQ